MPARDSEQILRIGVDVGGTFTDLVAWDGAELRLVKIPSTPPQFQLAVVDALRRVVAGPQTRHAIVHGSTVATNALLQRRVEPVAFVTTEGFRDMLLIARQNRPKLYALRVERPLPITPENNWFTVRERMDARGDVVEALAEDEIDRVIAAIRSRGLTHAAVCLLFSFINPEHERRLGAALERAGITTSLSCEVMSEFREYERASTTAINAALRPIVERYLGALRSGLNEIGATELRIMHSGGGTLDADDAARSAARLVVSGPAGGVIGAAFVAGVSGFDNIITYDMGGTSTDVATVSGGKPQCTTASVIDGLPVGLPMFQIHTIGAGGGSIAQVDAGGALRVGPQSAGAVPGPACYGRGGDEPTVTDANVVLGRIVPENFLGGAMRLDVPAAHRVIERLAQQLGKSPLEAALGVVRVVESNMAHAVRAVTSRRGRDPREFALVSFGGAGGLHACGIARMLEIRRVVVPPYCGVLSALGMIVAPPVVDVSQTVLHRAEAIDDSDLRRIVDELRERCARDLPDDRTESVELFADARFKGQSHELTVPIDRASGADIAQRFSEAYALRYGRLPPGREVQIVALRLRRTGRRADLRLPPLTRHPSAAAAQIEMIDDRGVPRATPVFVRADLLDAPATPGPILVIDPEATTYVPPGWTATVRLEGSIQLAYAPTSTAPPAP